MTPHTRRALRRLGSAWAILIGLADIAIGLCGFVELEREKAPRRR